MRYITLILGTLVILSSCNSGDRGQVVGAEGRDWDPVKPYGMTLVPGGAFIMGKSDEDMAYKNDAPPKTVSVPSFYMDETEITNSEYRQFVHWVRDSVFRYRLAEEADFQGAESGSGGLGEFAFKATEEGDQTPWEQYYQETYGGDLTAQRLNWDVDLIWERDDIPSKEYARVFDEMLIPVDQAYNGVRYVDPENIVYQYTASNKIAEIQNNGGSSGETRESKELNVYPDTTVWITDFNYSYNEPMHNDYFWHEAYSDYPVVGVSWTQAKAFCQWRTDYHNAYQREAGEDFVQTYRLPTEAEWEYAARGGLSGGKYPWGGPYAKNDRGCFLANFKPLRGDYGADQALYTVEAESFEPNEYNLYNMAGNVSEWVNSSYEENSYEHMNTLSPVVNDYDNKRKGVRGGSWKDVSYYLQVSTRDYEYADSARSYIGFRTVQSYPGDVTLNQQNF